MEKLKDALAKGAALLKAGFWKAVSFYQTHPTWFHVSVGFVLGFAVRSFLSA